MTPVHVERWLARAHASGLGSRALVCLLAATVLAPAPASPASPAARTESPVAPPPLADLDPENDFVVAPPRWIPDCEEQLRRAGVKFTPASMPVRPATSNAPLCGAPQAVLYRSGPEKISYGSSLFLTCGMALAMARFETVLNAEAEREFGQAVVRISHLGTYNCRRMARYPDWVSEHSYANAIDIASFTLKNGRKISVLKSFGRGSPEPRRAEAEFLDRLSHRLFDEDVFSGVITPAFDALHRNHFHLDLARYRVNGTAEGRPAGSGRAPL
jgi:hypothetical protein